ncbi:inorganic phosphate transporter [Cylindrospermum sp. FACHB-282]|uniref:inorganic phosphate transporter n=1 Tax=Cylindrospermum sp. FACHB-282 TaxID=2692794 RepID=UPI001688C657|nr:inorganic phosphate transporter [Cylindrospermum sp. FACHB-282]MBD2384305.1 inorganic phosphate transporter [Cylindrospermum sp. FACHB-282]
MPYTLVIVAILAFYVAWNLGANDVANAMGTSVGSKAVTLKQALIIAGVLEFSGAILFGQGVTETLGTKIANPALFATTPQTLVMGMLTVLLSSGVWLQIATSRGLPVSSSHAVVGAITGFTWVALGASAIDWSSLGLITIGWILTPLMSGAIAALFYSSIKGWILEQPNPVIQLQEWIPWLSTILLSVFGIIVLPTLTQPLTNFLINQLGYNIPPHDIPLFTGAAAAIGLTLISWRQLENSKIPNPVEGLFGRFQLLSACFVAFAHGSNDVGNAIAPLAVIVYINHTGGVPADNLTIPIWILILGGAGIVGGLAVWGKKVIATIGENIISLQPSSGFCAEIATATTILLASRLGLPVSTSHALVGGVVGIGLVQNIKSIKFSTLQGIAAAWLITVPISALLSAGIFTIARILFL